MGNKKNNQDNRIKDKIEKIVNLLREIYKAEDIFFTKFKNKI